MIGVAQGRGRSRLAQLCWGNRTWLAGPASSALNHLRHRGFSGFSGSSDFSGFSGFSGFSRFTGPTTAFSVGGPV